MSKKITMISEENFSESVDYAATLNRKTRSEILARKIVLPLGTIVLALNALLIFLGAIYALVYNNPERLFAFAKFSFIGEYWNHILGFFSKFTDLIYVKVILMITYLLIVPLALSCVLKIIISVLTKVEKPEIRGNTAEKAKRLYTYLKGIPQRYVDAFDEPHLIWRRISGITAAICSMVFNFYYFGSILIQSSDFAASITALFRTNENAEDIMICIIMSGFFYLGYAILDIVLSLITIRFYTCYNKWKKFTSEAERYWLSVDKKERERRDKASKESYDGWKYKSIGTSLYYKEKFDEYYAQYTGKPYETDEDRAKRIVSDVEDDLSGKGYGNY